MRETFSRSLKLCLTFRVLLLAYLALNYLPLWLALPASPTGYVLIYSSGLSESSVLSRYCYPLSCLAIMAEIGVMASLLLSVSRKQKVL